MSFVTFQNGYYDLKASLDKANSRLRFADFTVRVDRARCAAAREVERVPGVAAARVPLDRLGLELADGRQATARVVAVPDEPRRQRQRRASCSRASSRPRMRARR